MAYMQQRQDPFIGNAERMAQPPMNMQPIQQYGIQEPFYGQPGGNMQQQLMNAAPMTMSAMQPMNGFTPSMAYGGIIPQYGMGGLISLRGGGTVPMIYANGGYIPGHSLGGFFKGLGKFALKAAPYAAMFTPGGPLASAAIAAIAGTIEKKLGIDQESWGDVIRGRTVEKTPTSWKSALGQGAKRGIMAYGARKVKDGALEGWKGPRAEELEANWIAEFTGDPVAIPGAAPSALTSGPGWKGAVEGARSAAGKLMPSNESIIKYGPLAGELMRILGEEEAGGIPGSSYPGDAHMAQEFMPRSAYGDLDDEAQYYAPTIGRERGGPINRFDEPQNWHSDLSSSVPNTMNLMNNQNIPYPGNNNFYDPMLDIPQVGRPSNERDEEAEAAARAAIEDNKLASARAKLERLRLEELNRSQFGGRSPGEMGENTGDTPYDPMLDIPQVTSQSPLRPTVTKLVPPGPDATQEETDAWNNYVTAEGDRQRAAVVADAAAKAATDAAAKGEAENEFRTSSSSEENAEPDDTVEKKRNDVAPSGMYDEDGNLILDENYKPTYYTSDGKRPTNTYRYSRERKPDALATAGLSSSTGSVLSGNKLGPPPWETMKEMPEGYQAGLMSEGKLSPVIGHNPFSMPKSGFGTEADSFLERLKGGKLSPPTMVEPWQSNVDPTFDAQGNPTTAGVKGVRVPGTAGGGPVISAMDTVYGGEIPPDYQNQSGNVEGQEFLELFTQMFGEQLIQEIAEDITDMQNPSLDPNIVASDREDRLVEVEARKRLAEGEPVVPQALIAGGEMVINKFATDKAGMKNLQNINENLRRDDPVNFEEVRHHIDEAARLSQNV